MAFRKSALDFVEFFLAIAKKHLVLPYCFFKSAEVGLVAVVVSIAGTNALAQVPSPETPTIEAPVRALPLDLIALR